MKGPGLVKVFVDNKRQQPGKIPKFEAPAAKPPMRGLRVLPLRVATAAAVEEEMAAAERRYKRWNMAKKMYALGAFCVVLGLLLFGIYEYRKRYPRPAPTSISDYVGRVEVVHMGADSDKDVSIVPLSHTSKDAPLERVRAPGGKDNNIHLHPNGQENHHHLANDSHHKKDKDKKDKEEAIDVDNYWKSVAIVLMAMSAVFACFLLLSLIWILRVAGKHDDQGDDSVSEDGLNKCCSGRTSDHHQLVNYAALPANKIDA